MAKVVIVYESKHGNTKIVAEAIGEGIRKASDIETVISKVDEVDLGQIANSDAILVGSPNHIGKATRSIRKFINELGEASPGEKLVAAFDTYMAKDFEKAMKKMENRIDGIPGLKLIASGLSIKVNGMKGPITEGELPKCKEFGAKIAAQIADHN